MQTGCCTVLVYGNKLCINMLLHCVATLQGLVNSHSIFFDSLKSRGHALNYVQAESPELALKKFGDYLYDNILLAVDGQMSSAVREFAESCGIEFDARGSAVIDHFQHIPSADTRCVCTIKPYCASFP